MNKIFTVVACLAAAVVLAGPAEDKAKREAEAKARAERQEQERKLREEVNANWREFDKLRREKAPDAALLKQKAEWLHDRSAVNANWRLEAKRHLAKLMLQAGKDAEAEKLYADFLPVAARADRNAYSRAVQGVTGVHVRKNDLAGALAAVERARAGLAKDGNLPDRQRAALAASLDAHVVELYKTFYRFDEAKQLLEKQGDPIAVANLLREKMARWDEAEKIYLAVLPDTNQTHGARCAAYRALYRTHRDLTDRHDAVFAGNANWTTNDAIAFYATDLNSAAGAFFHGDYATAARSFRKLAALRKATKTPFSFMELQYGVPAAIATGDGAEDVAGIVDRAVLVDKKIKPAEAYQLRMYLALLREKGDVGKLTARVKRADEAFADGLDPKTRCERMDRVGSMASCMRNEALVRAIDAYEQTLKVPAPRKNYLVKYADRPVTGVTSWDALAVQPERQPLDRQYGGNMDFLTTDVSTGNRGDGSGKQAEKGKTPTLAVTCDAWGVHFRFDMPDPQARDIEAGFMGGGSLECYVAPGENTPYVTPLVDIGTGRFSFFNTMYNTFGHRRVTTADPSCYRSEMAYTDDVVTTYYGISWEAYATRIPSTGTTWDFETFLWGRKVSAAWNGSESIHGRSTWGTLTFEIPPEGRVAILKRRLFKAMNDYKAEKNCSHDKAGVLEFWRDDAIGDPAFYKAELAPLVAELDGYCKRITTAMSDADVLELAETALPKLVDVRFAVADRRRAYLEKNLTE